MCVYDLCRESARVDRKNEGEEAMVNACARMTCVASLCVWTAKQESGERG